MNSIIPDSINISNFALTYEGVIGFYILSLPVSNRTFSAIIDLPSDILRGSPRVVMPSVTAAGIGGRGCLL